MAQAERPTNLQVVKMLEQILRELGDVRKRQEELAEDLGEIRKALN